MKIIIRDIKTSIDTPACELKGIAARLAGISLSQISEFKILRRSLDARRRGEPHFCNTVELGGNLPESLARKYETVTDNPKAPLERGDERIRGKAVVVGSGPCGRFAAYTLAKNGLRPIVLES